MKIRSMGLGIRTLSLAIVALLAATVSQAQMGGSRTQATPMQGSTDRQQTELHELTDVQTQSGNRLNPKEEVAYKAFYAVNSELPDKKIQMGLDFLQKYPKSLLIEPVEVGLLNAYYAKQDWPNFYASADKALALKPDDVDVLTTVGWVIPHVYNASDADAEQKLDKAETYEKHAIDVLAAMPKPTYQTDAQFAASRNQKAVQVHSALGLVYFRREDYANSAKELQQSAQAGGEPDQADLYVLGVDLQNLKRYGDAADAFNRCGQISGGLQDHCKESAETAKRMLAVTK
jgi:tetratricopeptide (TPR) repeat protein